MSISFVDCKVDLKNNYYGAFEQNTRENAFSWHYPLSVPVLYFLSCSVSCNVYAHVIGHGRKLTKVLYAKMNLINTSLII